MSRRLLLRMLLAALLFAVLPRAAQAHKPSDAYLTLTSDGGAVTGRWDVAVRDLEYALGLDADLDGTVTWGELRRRHADVAAYAMARLEVQRGGAPCRGTVTQQAVDRHSDGTYGVLLFRLDCPRPGNTLEVDYRLFADLDPTHRGLLRVSAGEAGAETGRVLKPGGPPVVVEAGGGSESTLAAGWRQFASYWREGVWHIWIGLDHLLFLFALLLPAVLTREGGEWRPAGSLPAVLRRVAGVVTAFTVAHSLTLALAASGWVALPSRWVEATIAATVTLAALNNLVPVLRHAPWRAAFALGLIHGFGFAAVLRDLGLPGGAFARALVGFNLGVEVGQLALVALFIPLAFALRRTRFYRVGILGAGSASVAVLAALWFLERGFDLRLLP